MRGFVALAALITGTNALVGRSNGCCFHLSVTGEVNGTLGQISDGQNRVGDTSLPASTYCIDQNGGITDSAGRGCILTAETTQFQCDAGKNATIGFSISSSGQVGYHGNPSFIACETGQNGGRNIYTTNSTSVTQCKNIQMKADSCSGSGASGPGGGGGSPGQPGGGGGAVGGGSPGGGSPGGGSPGGGSPGGPGGSSGSGSAPSTTTIMSTVTVTAACNCPSTGAPAPAPAPGGSGGGGGASQPSGPAGGGGGTSPSVPPTSPSSTAGSHSSEAGPAGTPAPSSTGSGVASGGGGSQPSGPAGGGGGSSASPQPSTTGGTPPVIPIIGGGGTPPSVPSAHPSSNGSIHPSAPGPAGTSTPSSPVGGGGGSQGPSSTAPSSSPGGVPHSTSSAAVLSTSAVVAPYGNASTSSAKPSSTQSSGGACLTTLATDKSNYQYPHLVVPINSSSPDTAYGTQYFATISNHTSVLFNFDIPQNYSGKSCNLVFLFPQKADLETSDYTFIGDGKIDISQLSATASTSTTYNNAPSVSHDFGDITISPGHSYVVNTFSCPAGQAVGYEIKNAGSTYLHSFEDWNPSPLGLYITAC
ncbi:ubiquitin 3 binding protein But2 C-terminal domain-containing protein [Penicillium chermesinum]|nr:ubiquitin 3 binding protein But2 C-terminal domain-containing protein [Penicillium chermesinum]